jgi:hypothetical protein
MLKKLFPILLLILSACIDPYKIELTEGQSYLSVQGFITTEEGPHTVVLTRTATYGSVFEGLIRPVRQATVSIRDSEGVTVFLQEEGVSGIYRTPAGYRAEIGKSYSLQIQLFEGQTYASLPETVLPVANLQNVEFRQLRIPSENRLLDRVGVQLIANFSDPGDQVNQYFWRLLPATFQLVTHPERYTNPPDHPTNPRGPAPKECCALCYTQENLLQAYHVVTDENFNGLSTKEPVAYIEDNGRRFRGIYRADVQQMAISPNAYRFLKLVQQQIRISGSVFDQPPANIRGNMIGLSDPKEVVLGYFFAGASSINRIYIDQKDLIYKANPAIIPDDCRELPGTSVNPPSDWDPR